MKRSRKMGLLVLGTAVLLTGCSSNDQRDLKQSKYSSKEDCERDWGEPQVCTRGSGGVFMGPRYYWNHGSGTPMALMADGSERAMHRSSFARGTPSLAKSSSFVSRSSSVSRGGFGGFGRGSAGG